MSPFRAVFGEVDGASSGLLAVDPGTWDAVSVTDFTAGSLRDIAPRGTVAVDSEMAAEHGYEVGDVVPAEFAATGGVELRIEGVYEPDELVSGWLVATSTFDEFFSRPMDAAVLLAAAEGFDAADARATVEQVVAAYPAVVVQDPGEYRDTVAGQIDQMLALVTALLGMALFIAVLGIMNTRRGRGYRSVRSTARRAVGRARATMAILRASLPRNGRSPLAIAASWPIW